MNKEKIKEDIFEVIIKNIDEERSKLNQNSKVYDFELWDSIAHVKILLEISKKFKIKIPGTLFGNLTSVEDISNFIIKKVNK